MGLSSQPAVFSELIQVSDIIILVLFTYLFTTSLLLYVIEPESSLLDTTDSLG